LNKIREEAKDKIMDEIKQETFNKQIEGTKEDLEEIIGINIKEEKYMVYIGYKLFIFYIYIYKHIYFWLCNSAVDNRPI